MSMAIRTEQLGRVQIPLTEKHEKRITEKILLKLARIAIILMLSVTGFLLNSYLSSMNKAIDKISETQERLAIMVARIDETVRNTDQRLNRNENRLERLENRKP